VPLTAGLTASQVHTGYVAAHRMLLRDRPGRVWGLPLAVRVLLVLVHLRTNLTTRALAVVFATSQSPTDQIIGHLVPTLAAALRPQPAAHATPWIIDATHSGGRPVHHRPAENYRRSINTPDRHLLA
jgi:Helix-turn-helix of DDE superfamily endonuclease